MMQRVNIPPATRRTSVGVVQFLLLMVPLMLEQTRCEEASGSGCTDLLVPLSPPDSSSEQMPGLFLSSLETCGGAGCVSGWSFCYYSSQGNMDHSANVTFSLWRWSGNDKLEEVNGSKFSVDMKVLPEEQWLLCEERQLLAGCGVQMEEGDLVGVVISENTSLHLLGEVEGGKVMKADMKDRGKMVDKDSLHLLSDISLLVTPILSPGTCSNATKMAECSRVSSQTPTGSSEDELFMGTGDLVLLAVSAGLGLVILVLLTLLCFFLCIICRKYRSQKKGAIATVVLNSHREHKGIVAETDVEMHVLDTASSTHSTSLSPTPNGGTRVWQMDRRKTPPPIKPKPRHLSSRKAPPRPQLSEVRGQTPPKPQEATPSEPTHHASLLRSYSEEAIQLHFHPRDRRPPLGAPLCPRLQRRLSTGSLPPPSLDEDDYTIPGSVFRRSHLRPQPYLQPKTLEYSYAYSHVTRVVAAGLCTVPRGIASASSAGAPPFGKRGSIPASDKADDYDEIFVDQYWKEQHANQSSHTHSSSDHTPSVSEHPLLLSTMSDGYMNSDQFPQPLNPSAGDSDKPHPFRSSPDKPHPLRPSGSLDEHQSLQRHYTPLQPSMRTMSSSYYEVPCGSSSDVPQPPLFPSDYDHLDSHDQLLSN